MASSGSPPTPQGSCSPGRPVLQPRSVGAWVSSAWRDVVFVFFPTFSPHLAWLPWRTEHGTSGLAGGPLCPCSGSPLQADERLPLAWEIRSETRLSRFLSCRTSLGIYSTHVQPRRWGGASNISQTYLTTVATFFGRASGRKQALGNRCVTVVWTRGLSLLRSELFEVRG